MSSISKIIKSQWDSAMRQYRNNHPYDAAITGVDKWVQKCGFHPSGKLYQYSETCARIEAIKDLSYQSKRAYKSRLKKFLIWGDEKKYFKYKFRNRKPRPAKPTPCNPEPVKPEPIKPKPFLPRIPWFQSAKRFTFAFVITKNDDGSYTAQGKHNKELITHGDDLRETIANIGYLLVEATDL